MIAAPLGVGLGPRARASSRWTFGAGPRGGLTLGYGLRALERPREPGFLAHLAPTGQTAPDDP